MAKSLIVTTLFVTVTTTIRVKTLQGLGMLDMSVVLWMQGFSDSMVLWFRGEHSSSKETGDERKQW